MDSAERVLGGAPTVRIVNVDETPCDDDDDVCIKVCGLDGMEIDGQSMLGKIILKLSRERIAKEEQNAKLKVKTKARAEKGPEESAGKRWNFGSWGLLSVPSSDSGSDSDSDCFDDDGNVVEMPGLVGNSDSEIDPDVEEGAKAMAALAKRKAAAQQDSGRNRILIDKVEDECYSPVGKWRVTHDSTFDDAMNINLEAPVEPAGCVLNWRTRKAAVSGTRTALPPEKCKHGSGAWYDPPPGGTGNYDLRAAPVVQAMETARQRCGGGNVVNVAAPGKHPTHIEPDGDGSTGKCACRKCVLPVWPEDQGWCDLCFGNVGGACTCNCEGCGDGEEATTHERYWADGNALMQRSAEARYPAAGPYAEGLATTRYVDVATVAAGATSSGAGSSSADTRGAADTSNEECAQCDGSGGARTDGAPGELERFMRRSLEHPDLETGDCLVCGSITARVCSSCGDAYYCSPKCQHTDRVSHYYATDGACGEEDPNHTAQQRENATRRLRRVLPAAPGGGGHPDSSSGSSDVSETSNEPSGDESPGSAEHGCQHVYNGEFTCIGQNYQCTGLFKHCELCHYAQPVRHRPCTCVPQRRPTASGWAVDPDEAEPMDADQVVTGVSGDTVVVGDAQGSPFQVGDINNQRPNQRQPGFTRQFLGNKVCVRETGQPSKGVYGVPKILILFSGPSSSLQSTPDSSATLAGAFHTLGFDTVEFDILVDPRSDLLNYDVYNDIVWRIEQNEFRAVFAAPPCGTFSVARTPLGGRSGPTALRSRAHPMGLPGLSRIGSSQAVDANILLQRTACIILAVDSWGGHWMIENPVDRGNPGTQHYREAWRQHCPIWVMESMEQMYIGARQRPGSVDFAQCGLGGDYQKFTTLMFNAELSGRMRKFDSIACDHNSHKAIAFGQELDGTFTSSRAARYPFAMNVLIADIMAAQVTAGLRQLRPGNPDPHRQVWGENGSPSTSPCIVGYANSSRRSLTPETEAMLRVEALPRMNMVQRNTEWESPPIETRQLPAPLTTDQLIPKVVQDTLWRFRAKMKNSCESAARGRWQWARGLRPDPVYVPAERAMLPAGKGWTWWRNMQTNMWHPITASRYPESPPSTNLDLRAIVDYARASSFPDMQIIAWTANGFPGPKGIREGPKDVLFGALHVGAIKNYTDYKKCADKDVQAGFALPGVDMPVIWPMRGAPTNCVHSRLGKPRMTVDLTIQLQDGVASYNDSVAVDTQLINTKIEMCTVRELARAHAILLTAGVDVTNWGFDLRAYFRQLGTQRFDWWMSGTTRAEGFGRDERVQFGMREAMELTGRHTNFLVFAVRTELQRLDRAYPPHLNAVKQWVAERRSNVDRRRGCPHTRSSGFWEVNGRHDEDESTLRPEWDRDTALSAVCMFVDDMAGSSINDGLLTGGDRGGPWMARQESGAMVVHTRARMHYEAALGVIRHFGHTESFGKESPPGIDLVFLGVCFEEERKMLTLARWKRDDYASTAREVLGLGACTDREALAGSERGDGAIIVPYQLLNSLVHRLLHAASVIVMGRQHLHYMRQATRVTNRLGGNRCLLWARAQTELRWWIEKLGEDESVGLPFASRNLFPSTDPEITTNSLLISYSDASREFGQDFPESGWGGWCVICGFFYYVEGRWTEEEVALLSINVLELLAMNIAIMTFVAEAHRLDLVIDDVCEFTDNVAAEMSADRGNPHAEGMHNLVVERYEFFTRHNISSAATRVTSVENDIADGLSRGGRYMADALRMAAASNIWMRRLEPTYAVRNDASYNLREDARAAVLLG